MLIFYVQVYLPKTNEKLKKQLHPGVNQAVKPRSLHTILIKGKYKK